MNGPQAPSTPLLPLRANAPTLSINPFPLMSQDRTPYRSTRDSDTSPPLGDLSAAPLPVQLVAELDRLIPRLYGLALAGNPDALAIMRLLRELPDGDVDPSFAP